MDKPLKDCLPLKVTGKIEIAIKDKDGVTIAKHLTREDAEYIVSVLNNSATLTALLKEAGEALEPFEVMYNNTSDSPNRLFSQALADILKPAAEIRKKIQEVMG